MGSSAMGASVLRNKVKKAGLDVPVSNSAINNLTDDPKALIVTQVELKERASQKAPSALFITVENFIDIKVGDVIEASTKETKINYYSILKRLYKTKKQEENEEVYFEEIFKK